jgi:hypothetical protein
MVITLRLLITLGLLVITNILMVITTLRMAIIIIKMVMIHTTELFHRWNGVRINQGE